MKQEEEEPDFSQAIADMAEIGWIFIYHGKDEPESENKPEKEQDRTFPPKND